MGASGGGINLINPFIGPMEGHAKSLAHSYRVNAKIL